MYDALFKNLDGYAISADSRALHDRDNSDFTYGEVTPKSMQHIIGVLPKRTGIFCDLGSGTGKAVLLAAMLGEFDRSIGVELLSGLHDAAVEVGKRFESEMKPRLSATAVPCALEFRNEDIFSTDFSGIDVFLAHCTTCFSDELMTKFTMKCADAKPGAIIACASRRLALDCFQELSVTPCEMGWGTATLYVYRRR